MTPGEKLGPYEVLSSLGEGGMGEVWKARDTRLNRIVAIKRLKGEHGARFQQEARAIAALNHPHICQIYDVRPNYLVLEYIEGAPLAGPLVQAEALKVALQIAAALEAAHSKGILHRDLKPANVLVATTGAKLLDFGLAKLTADEDVTRTIGVAGTPLYMSPEQAEGKSLDARSDVFSFGAVLYELLAGRRAFDSLAAVLRDSPGVLPVSPELESVVMRCLDKSPAQRFQTMAELRAALERVRESPSGDGAVRQHGSRADEGFWIAVLPFKFSGPSPELATLAEGLSQEIIAGLSRFSYLRVMIEGSLGARYVLEGSLRQAGSQVRVSVQLIDKSNGAHLWAENYTRPYSSDTVFDVQDSLVPTIVSTVAEDTGVMAHSMWTALLDRDPKTLTPYEAMVRSFGFIEQLTEEECGLALTGLKRAIEQEPRHSGCLARLAITYANAYLMGYGTEQNPLDLSVSYARRAVAAEPSNHVAHHALCWAHASRKEIPAFRSAAERTLALNPLDSSTIAATGLWMAYTGDWQRGCELVERAMKLNPRHPGWYWYTLVQNAYRQNDYQRGLEFALRANLPGFFWTPLSLAIGHAQLGDRKAAAEALRDLLTLKPSFATTAKQELEKWFVEGSHVEHLLDGLRKAGFNYGKPDDKTESASPPQTPSIAVLPFANLSAEKEQEYFSDGLAEEVINLLSHVPGLKVIARTSSFAFRGKELDVRKIAEALDVRTILDGSVRKAGNRVRITAQLISATDGAHLWSDRYDRELTDIFAVQDEIAAAIAGQLKVSLSGKARKHFPPVAAYEAYLEARHHGYRLEPVSLAKSFDSIQRALALDPQYALAQEFLGGWYGLMAWSGLADPREMARKGRAALRQALELDPDLAHANAILGVWAGVADYDWQQAALHFTRAFELDGASFEVRQSYAIWHLRPLGRLEEALAELDAMRHKDPLSAFVRTEVAHVLLLLRRYEAVAEIAQGTLDLEPNHTMSMFHLIHARIEQGRNDEAIQVAERAAQLAPQWLVALTFLALAYARGGRMDDARRVVEQMHTLAEQSHANATAIAHGHMAIGDLEGCFDWLNRAIDQREPIITTLKNWPAFDSLHGDPRYPGLLRRMNLDGQNVISLVPNTTTPPLSSQL